MEKASESSTEVGVEDGVDDRVERAVGVAEPDERRHEARVDRARASTFLLRARQVASESLRCCYRVSSTHRCRFATRQLPGCSGVWPPDCTTVTVHLASTFLHAGQVTRRRVANADRVDDVDGKERRPAQQEHGYNDETAVLGLRHSTAQ